MDFRFGADVSRRNGDSVGSLHGLVYDPEAEQIVGLVIGEGVLAQHNVLAAIGTVATADNDQIYVDLTAEQVENLPDFEDERNIAPPPEPSPDTGDEITDPFDVPDVPPVGAATGVESIAFTPIIQETFHVPGRDVILDGTTEVWASDDQIGNLVSVRVSDQTKRPVSVVAGEGLIFRHDVAIPASQIAQLEPGRVVLSVDRQTVEADNRD